MKIIALALGSILGFALGTGLTVAGIVSILGFSPAVFCALALGVILAIAI